MNLNESKGCYISIGTVENTDWKIDKNASKMVKNQLWHSLFPQDHHFAIMKTKRENQGHSKHNLVRKILN